MRNRQICNYTKKFQQISITRYQTNETEISNDVSQFSETINQQDNIECFTPLSSLHYQIRSNIILLYFFICLFVFKFETQISHRERRERYSLSTGFFLKELQQPIVSTQSQQPEAASGSSMQMQIFKGLSHPATFPVCKQ